MMPRKVSGLEDTAIGFSPQLTQELLAELESDNEVGQPTIDELHFPQTKAVRVNVIWDKWAPLIDEKRTATILEAYRRFKNDEFSRNIALAIGLTVPEAVESGLLPFKIVTAWRADDPVTLEQCRNAMKKLGASTLHDNEKPLLRFGTLEEAEKCRNLLIKELPGSDSIWVIEKDTGPVERWAEV